MPSDLTTTDHTELVAQCEALLQRYASQCAAGVPSLGEQDVQAILQAGDDLTDLLRWERRYSDAVSLQDRLVALLPEQAQKFRVTAATLAIESGSVEQGLAQLRAEIESMDPAEGKLLMASTLTWLQRLEPAVAVLQELADDTSTGPADRAAASYGLFQVLNMAGRISDAVDAWEAATGLDSGFADTLPELVRAKIYWRDFEGAVRSVASDPSEIRRSFYRELVALRTNPGANRSAWDWVIAYDVADLGDAYEEFAEAALRGISPELALGALLPLIERQELTRQRLFLAGLAWAQQRQVERAVWALDLALRLAEIERPRRTRPGVGASRIFDAETRIAYGEIPVDADVRAFLDHYFMPKAAPADLWATLDATSAA